LIRLVSSHGRRWRRLICVNGDRLSFRRNLDAAQKRRSAPMTCSLRLKEEENMPVDAMILSAAIVTVFVIFGSVLYWGERQTRGLSAGAEAPKRRNF
jgi:hypothetical protein